MADDTPKPGTGQDPRLAFGTPEAVLERADLTLAEKRRILEQWRYDEQQLSDATAEHMEGGEEPMLGRVDRALHQLDERQGENGPDQKSGYLLVALFTDAASFTGAAEELAKVGVARSEINILSSYDGLKRAYGDVLPPESELAKRIRDPEQGAHGQDNLGTAAGGIVGGVAYLGATLGLAAAVVTGVGFVPLAIAGLAGGGVVGGLLTKVASDYNLERYKDQLEKGSLLVAVTTSDEATRKAVEEVLDNYGAQEITLDRADGRAA